jgi:hypothetical protein
VSETNQNERVVTPFKRENRYLIFKRKDVRAALTPLEQDILERIAFKVLNHRVAEGKDSLRCVVVERDWPEYEPTWAAIEKRMTGA